MTTDLMHGWRQPWPFGLCEQRGCVARGPLCELVEPEDDFDLDRKFLCEAHRSGSYEIVTAPDLMAGWVESALELLDAYVNGRGLHDLDAESREWIAEVLRYYHNGATIWADAQRRGAL